MRLKEDHAGAIPSAKPRTANGELLNYQGTVLFLYSGPDTGLVPLFSQAHPVSFSVPESRVDSWGREQRGSCCRILTFPKFQELISLWALREVVGGPLGPVFGWERRRLPHSLPLVLPFQALGWPELP